MEIITTILVTLITIYVTQRLDRISWRRTQRDEIRLDAIKEFNGLAAEYINAQCKTEDNYKVVNDDFRKAWEAMSAQLKVLFSDRTYEVFKKLELMMSHRQLKTVEVITFSQHRDAVLQSMYREIVPLKEWTVEAAVMWVRRVISGKVER